MIHNKFGNTGLEVSLLGYGAGHIGRDELDEDFVGSLLNQIVDKGITLIDTAKGYGQSEARIGRHLSYRRKDFILSTKVGYGIDGYEDWTYDGILAGVEQALKTMQTDYIDIVHLHSPSEDILRNNNVIEALHRCVEEGMVKASAYSGENLPLSYAVEHPLINSIQCSSNIFDQRSLNDQIKFAKNNGKGVIAKRPLGNAPWRFNTRPDGNYCEVYWDRMKAMGLDSNSNLQEIALRYAAFSEGVSSIIVGSTNIEHITQNIDTLLKGKLSAKELAFFHEVFKAHDNNWIGQV